MPEKFQDGLVDDADKARFLAGKERPYRDAGDTLGAEKVSERSEAFYDNIFENLEDKDKCVEKIRELIDPKWPVGDPREKIALAIDLIQKAGLTRENIDSRFPDYLEKVAKRVAGALYVEDSEKSREVTRDDIHHHLTDFKNLSEWVRGLLVIEYMDIESMILKNLRERFE